MQVLSVCRALVALLATVLLSHCAPIPTQPEPPPPQVVAPAAVSATPRPPLSALLVAHPLLDAPHLQNYTRATGERLLEASGKSTRGWRFGVIDHADAAGYALPRAVYLTRGLVARLNSEAEFAAAIARELAHLLGGHTPLPRPPVESLPGLLGPVADFAIFPAAVYSPEDTRDGDARAAQMLARAGFEPRALLAIAGRNDEVRKRVVELARLNVEGEFRTGRDDFLQRLDHLPYGDAPALGVLQGSTLRHAEFGIAITFPKGWDVLREPGRVLARAPDGDGLIELVPVQTSDPALARLQNMLALDPGARHDEGAINGLTAAFAVGTAVGRPVLASALRDPLRPNRLFIVAVQSRDNSRYLRDRTQLRATLNSVRPLSDDERPPLQQLHLRIRELDVGSSIARLAAASPLGSNAAVILRSLNGLAPRGELKAGQRIKLVE